MKVTNKKMSAFSIVLIGSFSPERYQPYWFKHYGIFNDEEIRAIEQNGGNTIVTSELTSFEGDTFSFKIERNRMTLIAKHEPFELLIDVFAKMQEKLGSVIIERFGMNFSFHIGLETAENMKKFGDAIAPKDCWTVFLQDKADDEENSSGLVSMTMRKVTEYGCINTKIETSNNFKNAVFFDYNFHYEGNADNPFDIMDVKELIDDNFKKTYQYTNEISDELLKTI